MGWSVLSKKPSQGWVEYLASCLVGGEASEVLGRKIVAAGIGSDGNYYAAIQEKVANVPRISAVIALIEGSAYKIMGEEEGPYYYGCPAEVLKALSPTVNPFALKWRAKCAGVAA